MPACQAFIRGHLDELIDSYGILGAELRAAVLHFSTFNATLFASALALLGEVERAREQLEFVDSTPPESRAGFRWWTERARVLTDVADGDVEGGVARSLELIEQYRIEEFSVTTSLEDVVRFGQAERAVSALRVQTEREGATWWDHTCLAHAEAAVADDGDALMDVSARFEAGGLDLYACEAAAQAAQAYARVGHKVAELGATERVAELLSVCGTVRTPALELDVRVSVTDRELQVAKLAARGMSNAEIADRLGTSARTVGNQLQRAYEKLGVHNRGDLQALLDGERRTHE